MNNGLLPALVREEDAARLITLIGDTKIKLRLDIQKRKITFGDQTISFTLSESWTQKLINGWDDIDLTEHHRPAISAYRARRAETLPWVFPAEETAG